MTVVFVPTGFQVIVNGVELKTYTEVILGGIFPLIKKVQYTASKSQVTRAKVVGGQYFIHATFHDFISIVLSVQHSGLAGIFGYSTHAQMLPALYTTLAPLGEATMDEEEDLVVQIYRNQLNYGYIPFEIEQVRYSSPIEFSIHVLG